MMRSWTLALLAVAPLATAGEPTGLRDALARRGVTFAASVQADWSSNVAGGARRGTALRRPLGFGLDVDPEPLLGWRGARLHAGFQSHAGRHGTDDLVGDAQGFDNVDAPGFRQVSELWLEQSLQGGRLRLKIGKVDASSEFARVLHGGEFLNSSAGFSPTIQGFPTYPDPAASVNAFVAPFGWLWSGAGIYDGATRDGCHGRTGNQGLGTLWGAPSSLFLVGEAGVRWTLRGKRGQAGAGLWRHTARVARLDGGSAAGTSGAYAILDQVVWTEGDGVQGLGLFAQWGGAEADVSDLDRHLAVGAAWSGPLPGRKGDALGLMVSAARFSAAGRSETAIELFYRLQVAPWLSVKPDLQYVVDPGGRGAPAALVGTVRTVVAF